MDKSVKLDWLRFTTWTEALDGESNYQFPCVYILAEKNGKPLYIGKASRRRKETKGRIYAGGLRARYFHDWTVLDACMEGTGRSIFIAEVDPKNVRHVEAQLIYENQPKYNTNSKASPPKSSIVLKHSGVKPSFASL